MLSIQYCTLKKSLKHYLNLVSASSKTIIVKRKSGNHVIIMSEKTYNNLIENNYVRQSKANYDWILQSMKQLNHGDH